MIKCLIKSLCCTRTGWPIAPSSNVRSSNWHWNNFLNNVIVQSLSSKAPSQWASLPSCRIKFKIHLIGQPRESREVLVGFMSCISAWPDCLLGWPMIMFMVMGILVIVSGLSYGPRKRRLYIDVIGNLRLWVKKVRALSPMVPNHMRADVRARSRLMGRE